MDLIIAVLFFTFEELIKFSDFFLIKYIPIAIRSGNNQSNFTERVEILYIFSNFFSIN